MPLGETRYNTVLYVIAIITVIGSFPAFLVISLYFEKTLKNGPLLFGCYLAVIWLLFEKTLKKL
jgi:hypothetical protein